jgi:nicotinamide phosphoribosyltransferase
MNFGKISLEDLSTKSREDLIKIIIESQLKENFILATDSYKMTHHLLYPEGLTEVYSYLEPRGGEMSHTLFFGLQYYVKKYLAGVRITKENIEEAHQQNIKHFGFDCFNRELWDHIVNDCGGKLPLEIKAVKEGMRIPVKNALIYIRNTNYK